MLGIFSGRFFGGIFWDKCFRMIFWEDFLGGFLGGLLWEEFFVYIEIDLFVKILVFVKILSKWRRRKEGGRISILRSASASTSHLKKIVYEESSSKSAKIALSTSIFDVKNQKIFSDFFFYLRVSSLVKTLFSSFNFWATLFCKICWSSHDIWTLRHNLFSCHALLTNNHRLFIFFS